ncbi:MAG: chromosomal protein MC1 [DPANN group archaeon]|nr:chromosomal protein MC1 [DPANN group archaeon]
MTRYFVLVQGSKETDHVFTGSSPRRAALKAATRGFTDIRLRERGTDRLHSFKGSRKKASAPTDRPAWLPAQVWRPVVRKVSLVHLKE